MPHNAVYWLVATFVISFFFVGVPYRQIPCAKVSLASTLLDTGLLVVGILAAAARAFGKPVSWRWFLLSVLPCPLRSARPGSGG